MVAANPTPRRDRPTPTLPTFVARLIAEQTGPANHPHAWYVTWGSGYDEHIRIGWRTQATEPTYTSDILL